MIDSTAFKVVTPQGNCFATFPENDVSCKLIGLNIIAIEYFKSNLHGMFKTHGYPVELTQIEPDDFLNFCHRPDLGILIESEFADEEYEMLK